MIDVSLQTIIRATSVLRTLAVPAACSDCLDSLYHGLLGVGIAPNELMELEVVPSGRLSWSGDDVMRAAWRGLKPWTRILTRITHLAEIMAETYGGVAALARAIESRDIRELVLRDLGQVIADVIDQMDLKEVVTPEQAVLCLLSSSEVHNDWYLIWFISTLRKVSRFDEIFARSRVLKVLRAAKEQSLLDEHEAAVPRSLSAGGSGGDECALV